MKNLFGINMTNESEEELSCELKEFVIRSVDPELSKRQEEAGEKLEAFEKKWAFPTWLTILRIALVGLGSILLVTVIRAIVELKSEAFSKPVTIAFLVVGAILICAGVILFVIENNRKRAVEGSDEYKGFVTYLESLSSSVETDLKIPSDAKNVDIFYYPYKEKNGEIKDNQPFKYLNQELSVFLENGCLCLADSGYVYGINLKHLKRMIINPKSVTFAQWNKDESCDKGIYKEYKIGVDNMGVLHVKNSCSVQFTKDEVSYEIVIPPYEIKLLEELTGLKAETEK